MSQPLKTKIKPGRDGLRVRKPDGGVLDSAGEAVIWTPYWQRRLTDGDVQICKDEPAKPSKAGKE